MGSMFSVGGIVGWLRRGAMHLFICKIRGLKVPTRVVFKLIDTR